MATDRYYVRAETKKGAVVGYGVYDCVGGMESQHAYYPAAEGKQTWKIALYLANQHRDDMNKGIK